MRKYNYSLIKKTTERFGLAKGTSDIEYPLGKGDSAVTLARLFGNTQFSDDDYAYLSVADKSDDGKYRLTFTRPGRNLMSSQTYAELHKKGSTGYATLTGTQYYYVATPVDDGKTIVSREDIAFKPNTVYTVAAEMQYYSQNPKFSPLQAKVVYTDGSEDPIRFAGGGTKVLGVFSTARGKSVDRITHYRENSAPTMIMLDKFGIFEGAYQSYADTFEPYGSFEGALILEEPLRSVGFVSDILDLCALTVKRKICELVIDGSVSVEETDDEGIFKVLCPHTVKVHSPIISEVRKRSYEDLISARSGAAISEDGSAVYIKLDGIFGMENFQPRVTESPVQVFFVREDYSDESVSGDPILEDTSGAAVKVTTKIPPKKQIMIYKRKD